MWRADKRTSINSLLRPLASARHPLANLKKFYLLAVTAVTNKVTILALHQPTKFLYNAMYRFKFTQTVLGRILNDYFNRRNFRTRRHLFR